MGIKQQEVRHPPPPKKKKKEQLKKKREPRGDCAAVCTRSLSSLMHTADPRCPGNHVLKILNLDLTYNTSYVSPQSRNGISGRRTFHFSKLMSVRCDAAMPPRQIRKKKDDLVSPWAPQVMLPSIFLGSKRQKSFALPFDCDAVCGFNGICQKMWAARKRWKTWLRAVEQFRV